MAVGVATGVIWAKPGVGVENLGVWWFAGTSVGVGGIGSPGGAYPTGVSVGGIGAGGAAAGMPGAARAIPQPGVRARITSPRPMLGRRRISQVNPVMRFIVIFPDELRLGIIRGVIRYKCYPP